MIKIILVVVVLLVGGVLLVASTRPDALHVERATDVKAPP